ncbi:MAG TPA: type IV secretory system conjugative DNA transfer family protein, partial [Acidimicrobiales bacterium]|nr:type IV secretory system conjugative DNA transfer family protein [Acidimicrobiales bacterium]
MRGPGRLYIGVGHDGPVWAAAEQAMLVLGPPRSGKTSGIVVPTVLGAEGPVVSTSTKPDVLQVTAAARGRRGPCLLFDPSGTVEPPPGVEVVRWSPVQSAATWDDALLVARALVGAARGQGSDTAARTDHWSERAEALLAPLLHAAHHSGESLASVLSWVDRRQPAPALRVLDECGAAVAADGLAGIAATDEREQSGIWSTASGVLSAYRSDAALRSTVDPDFDAALFCASDATLYVCATGRHQARVAPLVVGLLTDIRSAAYEQAALDSATGTGPAPATPSGRDRAPVVFALDEVANIAPIPDLPAMVSEGGGQGVLTLACLQDLSQARTRWGPAADGFLSLFGTTVVLGGIGDTRTLEALSVLAGEEEVWTRSVSGPLPGSTGGGALRRAIAGRRSWSRPEPAPPTMSVTSRRQRRLAPDVIGRG